MILTTFSRILTSGIQTFKRNAWLSVATIGVLALMLFIFSSLVMINFLTQQIIATLQNKIDVSIYFDPSTNENDILQAQNLLQQLPEVKDVEYISRDQALNNFSQRHQGNDVITQALQELGTNPLQAALNIKAKDSSQYASIISFINGAPFKSSISKVNYTENEIVIQRLTNIVRAVEKAGTTLSVVLAVIASLIIFNTVRMAIYSLREEIGIMKLVGASNWFARGPFIIMGIIVSVIASLIAFAVLYPLTIAISPHIDAFMPGTNLAGFLNSHWLGIFFMQTMAGIFLGILSTIIALNKYLQV